MNDAQGASGETSLLSELRAGLAEDQALLEELAGTLAALRREAQTPLAALDRDRVWREVVRKVSG